MKIQQTLHFVILVAAMAAGIPARADSVAFSTTGIFGNGSNTITVDGVTLTFTGVNTIVDADPIVPVSFGTFTATGVGPATFDTTFQLTVTEAGNSFTLTDNNLQGTIGPDSSNLAVTFTTLPACPPLPQIKIQPFDLTSSCKFTFGSQLFSVNQQTTIDSGGTNGSTSTSLGGSIETAAPEPSFLLLIAMGSFGLAGVALIVRRSRLARTES